MFNLQPPRHISTLPDTGRIDDTRRRRNRTNRVINFAIVWMAPLIVINTQQPGK